jgi:hypothetical protein
VRPACVPRSLQAATRRLAATALPRGPTPLPTRPSQWDGCGRPGRWGARAAAEQTAQLARPVWPGVRMSLWSAEATARRPRSRRSLPAPLQQQVARCRGRRLRGAGHLAPAAEAAAAAWRCRWCRPWPYRAAAPGARTPLRATGAGLQVGGAPCWPGMPSAFSGAHGAQVWCDEADVMPRSIVVVWHRRRGPGRGRGPRHRAGGPRGALASPGKAAAALGWLLRACTLASLAVDVSSSEPYVNGS